jgi:predicted DNA-binding transcriptional regulator AlpA
METNSPQEIRSEIRLVSAPAAAAFLGLQTATLAKWRWAGSGPRYRKLGRRVLYDLRDLEAFIAASARQSTSAVMSHSPL